MNIQVMLDFILSLDALKGVERRSVPSGMKRRENSAEHSWHAALCALLLEGESAFGVNVQRAALLLLMHDVPEIGCGDTFAYAVERSDATVREARALDELLSSLPAVNARELRALWEEFAANRTPEARYANAIDRLIPLLQNLSHGGLTWREHDVRLEQILAHNGQLAEVFPAIWAIVLPRIQNHFREEILNERAQ